MYEVRLWVKIGIAVVLSIIVGYAIHKYDQGLIEKGENTIKAKDAELVQAQTVHKQEVEDRAKQLSKTQVDELKAQLEAKPAPDAPHLVCLRNNTRESSGGSVRQATAGRSSSSPTEEQPKVVQEAHDYGPDIDKRFADDDALIKALQERVVLDLQTCGS